MCHYSKFLETWPLEYYYAVENYVLKSAWVILRLVFEARLKNPGFAQKSSRKVNNGLLRVDQRASGFRYLSPCIY